jgi:hypothetical protein
MQLFTYGRFDPALPRAAVDFDVYNGLEDYFLNPDRGTLDDYIAARGDAALNGVDLQWCFDRLHSAAQAGDRLALMDAARLAALASRADWLYDELSRAVARYRSVEATTMDEALQIKRNKNFDAPATTKRQRYYDDVIRDVYRMLHDGATLTGAADAVAELHPISAKTIKKWWYEDPARKAHIGTLKSRRSKS